MTTKPQYSYAWEKLYQAVHDLMVGQRTLQRRLANAGEYLIRLRQEDLPGDLWDDLSAIVHELRPPMSATEQPRHAK